MTPSRKTMSLRLDLTWDTEVAVERDMVERLCGHLAGRAENFLVIEDEGTYQPGLGDVRVDVGVLDALHGYEWCQATERNQND